MRKAHALFFVVLAIIGTFIATNAYAKERYFVGVGIELIHMEKAGWLVVTTYYHSPIHKMIGPTDAIIAIDGNDISQWTEADIFHALNDGPIGSIVHIKMKRWFLQNRDYFYEIDVARAKIDRVADYLAYAPIHDHLSIPIDEYKFNHVVFQSKVSEDGSSHIFSYWYQIKNETSQTITIYVPIISRFYLSECNSVQLCATAPLQVKLNPGESKDFTFTSSLIPGSTLFNDVLVSLKLSSNMPININGMVHLIIPEDWVQD